MKWVFIEPGKLGQSHGWIFNSSCLDIYIYISKPVRKTTINFHVLLIDLKVADFRIMSTFTTSKWVEERKKRHMHLKLKILETLALSKPPQVACAKVLILFFSLVFPPSITLNLILNFSLEFHSFLFLSYMWAYISKQLHTAII